MGMDLPQGYARLSQSMCPPEREEQPPKGTPPTKGTGTKHDGGKRRYDLMPDLAEGAIVDVLTFGATKYGDRNWEGLERLDDRCFAACRRHLARWREGEHTDPETGLPHVAHAILNLIFILEKQLEAKANTHKASP